jgi:hypothetical protein
MVFENGSLSLVLQGGANRKAWKQSISGKVVLLLPYLCLKMSEINANQMRMVFAQEKMWAHSTLTHTLPLPYNLLA